MIQRLVLAAFAAWLVVSASPASVGPFDSWAAIVVAGDSHAHSGAPSDVFDNARRDLAKDLKEMGFAENHIQQYSARPDLDPATMPMHSDARLIYTNFKRLTEEATGGCFVYFTSHGAPLGIRVGDSVVTIRAIGDIIDDACFDRPTVIIVSACYSGMFIPVLHADNRMIMTAARPDRTSFGCGEANHYTFFDQCVLESVPMVPNFPALADKTKDCVAAREKEEGAMPPSEPQLYVGARVQSLLQTENFSAN